MSLADFGKLVGMSVANLCDIEKGRKGVSPEKAEQIAKAIGVPQDSSSACPSRRIYGGRAEVHG